MQYDTLNELNKRKVKLGIIKVMHKAKEGKKISGGERGIREQS